MIVKFFELTKIDIKKSSYFLLYGENNGHKNQILEEVFKKLYNNNIFLYEENELLQKVDNFYNEIFSKSFFEKEKLIIVNRATDKIKDVIEEIIEKKVDDLVLVLNSGILEKKSKLRSLFEKNKKLICVPFYEDNNQTLSSIVSKFLREKKILISQQSINLIVQRSRGDRQNLKSELEKVQNFAQNKNKISTEDIIKLTNLAENYSVSELVDNCLAKNKKKTINILNENNYSLEDCILIIRTFLVKSKRLLKLSKDIDNGLSVDSIISSFKPPIFWKDKEIIKMQVKNWSFVNVESLIYKINETELLIKKNSSNSISILANFIIEQSTTASN